MAPQLYQTYLLTANIEQSRTFYASVLGLDIAKQDENSVAFDTGGCMLKVEADHDKEAMAVFGLEPPGSDRGRGVVIVLEVDDVDAIHERAVDDDTCEILSPPRQTDWGRYLCLLADPDGYVVEASQPL